MNKRQRMQAAEQLTAGNQFRFSKDPLESLPLIMSPQIEPNFDVNDTFDHLNRHGYSSSLNGRMPGKYSQKQMAVTINNSIHKVTNELKPTRTSISGISTTFNQGGSLLTSSMLQKQPSNVKSPSLSIIEVQKHKLSVGQSGLSNTFLESQHLNQINSNTSSNAQMSVAAKAGEMQIFCQDIYTSAPNENRRTVSKNNRSLTTVYSTGTHQYTAAHQQMIHVSPKDQVYAQHHGNGRIINSYTTCEDGKNNMNRPSQIQTQGEYIPSQNRITDNRLQRNQVLTNQLNQPSSMNVNDLREFYGNSNENESGEFSLNALQQSQHDNKGPIQTIVMQKIELPKQQSGDQLTYNYKIRGLTTTNASIQKSDNKLQLDNMHQTLPINEIEQFPVVRRVTDDISQSLRNSVGVSPIEEYENGQLPERFNSVGRNSQKELEIDQKINHKSKFQKSGTAKKLSQAQSDAQMKASLERNEVNPTKMVIAGREKILMSTKHMPMQSNPNAKRLFGNNDRGKSGYIAKQKQLNLSLTGTKVQSTVYLQEQQRLREQQFLKFNDSAYASVSTNNATSNTSQTRFAETGQTSRNLTKSRIRNDGKGTSTGFKSQGQVQNNFLPTAINPQSQLVTNDFLQKQMMMGTKSSPQNGSILGGGIDSAGEQNRCYYAYNCIYEYLFIQVSELHFQKEYQFRFRMRNNASSVGNIIKEANDLELTRNDCLAPLNPSVDAQYQQVPPRYRHSVLLEDPQSFNVSNIGLESAIGSRSNSVSILHEVSKEEVKGNSKLKKLPPISGVFENAIKATQHDGLKVLTPESIYQAYADYIENNPYRAFTPISEFTEEECLIRFMKGISGYLAETHKRFKITVKKKYINDLLLMSKGAQNVAQNTIILVTNHPLFTLNSPKKPKQVKRKVCSDMETDEEAGGVVEEKTHTTDTKHQEKKPQQLNANKQKAVTVARRGYESESEVKSLNSTTTSSTFPKFSQVSNLQANTPKDRKITTRSLSQIPKSGRQIKKDGTEILSKNKEYMTINVDEIANNYFDKYEPTKIKIVQKTEMNLKHVTHPINRMFSDYNEFTKLVFRSRVTEPRALRNIPQAIKLGRRLGMQLTRNQLLPQTLKLRENSQAIKEKIIMHMCKVLNKQNKWEPEENVAGSLFGKSIDQSTVDFMAQQQEKMAVYEQGKSQNSHYKCYIGRGNNSMMVRTLFKSRHWWLFVDSDDSSKVNFMWTQLKKASIMDNLKCKLANSKGQKDLTTPNTKLHKRKTSASTRSPESGPQTDEKGANVIPSLIKIDPANINEDQRSPSAKEESKKEPVSSILMRNQPTKVEPFPYKLYNKIEDNYHLSNKKALFVNMKTYYEAMHQNAFDSLPVTFHVKDGLGDTHWQEFSDYYNNRTDNETVNMWIIKPGENTNRGQGIQVAKSYDEIKQIVEESTSSRKRTCIIQQYIDKPLLYNRRKFDIRTYALATSINGNFKGFYYQEGYIRTSCREFNLHKVHDKMIHLTNDAIQKKCEDYGKFEAGNKLSYVEFQNYLDKNQAALSVCFERDILPQFKKLTADCFRASWGKMDPGKRMNTFEVFGLDFMLDEDFKVYLIEVNTNPCLELASPLLARLIPAMLENSLRLSVDPVFPPPENFSQRKHVVNELCPENKFDLVFDENIDGPELKALFKENDNIILELDAEELSDSEEFDDEDE